MVDPFPPPDLKVCRICRTRPADSKEHLIPSAIGGWREVEGVLCRGCNSECGRGIDAVLAERCKPLRVILGIKGDRGQAPSLTVTDADGTRMHLDLGMSPRAAEGPLEVIENDDGTRNVTFASERQSRDYTDAMKRKRPGDDVVFQNVQIERSFPGPVDVPISVGGGDMARSCIKSVLTMIAYKGLPETALEGAWKCVHEGTRNGVSVDLTASPRPWTPNNVGPVAHSVAVSSSRRERAIRFHVRLFGGLAWAGCLATDVDVTDWAAGYAIDPITGVEDETTLLDGNLDEPPSPRAEVERAANEAMAVIRQVGHERSAEMLTAKIGAELMSKHFGPPGARRPITPDTLPAFLSDFEAEVAQIVSREPWATPDPELEKKLNERGKQQKKQ